MGNAIWLFSFLPETFIDFIGASISEIGWIGVIPTVGICCGVPGAIWAVLRRWKGALLFLISIAASHLTAAAAGFFRGRLDKPDTVLIPFFIAQILFCSFIFYRYRQHRVTAVLCAVFCLSYAFVAWFISTMAFRDVWL